MSTPHAPAADSQTLQRLLWCSLWLVAAAALTHVAWTLLAHTPYRIDIDVYRLGARAWLDGHPLYTRFHTEVNLDLPFIYPPLAAILFSPFAWLPLTGANIAITALTLVLLIVSVAILLTRLDVWAESRLLPGPAWLRRLGLAVLVASAASKWMEPIVSNFEYGQINVIVMTLVIADCVPRRTPWPRGLLLGLGIALKLTPAVFLLYLLLRRDIRAALTTLASFVGVTLVGFALAWSDSWKYWTDTVAHTDRDVNADYFSDQNIAGALARLGLPQHERILLWLVASLIVLAATVWAMRRALSAGEPLLALICVALFALLASPLSWTHHWVWMLPGVLVTGVLGWRYRDVALGALGVAGIVLAYWEPYRLLPEHHEIGAVWWRQLLGISYVWWAIAVIVGTGITAYRRRP